MAYQPVYNAGGPNSNYQQQNEGPKHPPAELYNGPRATVDKPFAIVFVVAILTQFVIGSWMYSKSYSYDSINKMICECDGALCTDGISKYMAQNLLYLMNEHAGAFYGSMAGIVCLLFLYAYLIKSCANLVVWTCVIGKPVLIVAFLIWINNQPGVEEDSTYLAYTAAYIGFYCFVVWWYRESIRFSAKVLGKTGEAIAAWPSMVVTGMAVNFCTIFFSLWLFAVSNWAYMIGTFDEDTCTFEPLLATDNTFYAISTIFFFVAYWIVAFFDMAILYTVATSIANWYFSLTSAPMDGHPVVTGLKRAFTTNFGSVAFAALIVTIAEGMKRKARRRRASIGGLILSAVMMCCANFLEYVSRYALVLSAITGGSLLDSAKTAYHTLSHFFVGGFVNDRVANLVLFALSWAMSLLAGMGAWVAVEASQGQDIFDDISDMNGFIWFALLVAVMVCMYFPYFGLFVFLLIGQFLVDSIGDGLTIGLFVTLIAGIVFNCMGSIVMYSMASVFTCYAIDMLNGGQSPHSVDIEMLMNNSAMEGVYIYNGNINADAEKGKPGNTAVYSGQPNMYQPPPTMQ